MVVDNRQLAGNLMGIKEIALLVLGIAKGGIDLLLGRQKRQEREAAEQAGMNKQKVADLEDDRQKASQARQISEDVDGMSDSAVTDGLRKYARKADC